MKNILITGANSYVGTSFARYLDRWPESYRVDTVDMIDGSWRERSFQGYDAVFHVAGIVHMESSKNDPAQAELYDRVNHLLAVETAAKAKADGVKQFIFMSSAIVYGNSAPMGKQKMITRDTPVSPDNCYGDSKVQAENGLIAMEDEGFKVVILRPPMIYGRGSKGNYPLLSKMAQKLPFFPDCKNQRSMLYIENLCEFVKLMVVNEESGIFWPQNSEYTNTSQMVKMIADVHGKKIKLTKLFNPGLMILRHITPLVDKAFGSLTYDLDMSRYPGEEYDIVPLRRSVEKTEEVSER